MPMHSYRNRFHAAHVALVAASVSFRIAVQNLVPEAAVRDSYLIIVSGHGREVTDNHNRVFFLPSLAQET